MNLNQSWASCVIDDFYQYIFLENPKAASYSVKHALMGEQNVHSPYDVRMGSVNHKLPSEIQQQYPEKWVSYHSFTVVRNTWDRAKSFFEFYRNKVCSESYQTLSFDEWIMLGCPPPKESFLRSNIRISSQDSLILCQLRYTIGVDEIILLPSYDPLARHKELLAGLIYVADKFGFPLHPLPVDKNNSGRTQQQTDWNHQTVAKIHDMYREEIERFGFKAPRY